MKKKILLISILVFILLVFAGIFFINQKIMRTDPNSGYDQEDFNKRLVTYNDFKKRTENENTWLDNEKAKISLKLPKGWELIEEAYGFVSLKSDDFVPFDNDWKKIPLATSGCWTQVDIKIEKIKENYQNIAAEYIKQRSTDIDKENINEEIIDLKYSKAIKYTVLSKELDGKIIRITIPNQNITYNFASFLFGKDKEKCEQEFNIFLASLAIKI
jgi:hypothetical protein